MTLNCQSHAVEPRWILSSRKYYEPRTVITRKSEEFNLSKHSWIPTVGHKSVVKNNINGKDYLIYIGGVQSSRVSGYSSYMFCQVIGQDFNEVWLEDLQFKKPNQITSHVASQSMNGSILKVYLILEWLIL